MAAITENQHFSYVQVLGSDVETQKALAPFLKNRALRKVIQTFTNDSEACGVSVWGSNKEVLRLLTEAKRLMDGGAVTEDEMEARLLAQLKVSARGLAPTCSDHHQQVYCRMLGEIRAGTLVSVIPLTAHLLSALLFALQSNSEAGAQLQSHQKITLGMEQLVSALNEHVSQLSIAFHYVQL